MRDKQADRFKKFKLIDQWQQSGLTQKSFCAANNIPYHVFHYWYGVYRSEKHTSRSFVPIQIKPAGVEQQITVTGVNGIQIRLPISDQSVSFVKQLLS